MKNLVKYTTLLLPLAFLACQSKVDQAYDKCLTHIEKSAANVSSSVLPNDMAEGMEDKFKQLAAKTCGQMKSACEQDQNSEACQKFLQDYK